MKNKIKTEFNWVVMGKCQVDVQYKTRRAVFLLLGLSVFMTCFIVVWLSNGFYDFVDYIGFNKTALHIPYAWGLALLVAVSYIVYTMRMIPLVRENIFNFSGCLKWIGVYAAFTGGLVEELVFRQMLMSWLNAEGVNSCLQVAMSGLVFGLVHFSWMCFGGNLYVGFCSVLSTAVLGFLLAVVYLLADYNVLPAVFAHIVINIFVEPWLILNAIIPQNKETSES